MNLPAMDNNDPPSVFLPAALPERLARLVQRVPRSGTGTRAVLTPFDHRPLGSVPLSEPADVRAAAIRARRVQEDWAQRPLRERAKVLLEFHDRILDRQAEVLDLIQLENGKARYHAFEEVADAALVARFYGSRAEEYLAPKSRQGFIPGFTQTWEVVHPKGLIGIISPWNYPLSMGITDALPALLAGNGVLIKPDLQTPFTLLWALDLLVECGLPEGLMVPCCGEGPILGPEIIAHCDFLQFTGSTATGRLVAQQAASRLIGASLELGGKNPMLVLADADLDAAVSGAVRSSFASAGQLCVSTERIYVHESLYPAFLERMIAATRALRLGVGLGWDYDVGTLTSAAQLERVERHVQDAVARGAQVQTGGNRRPDIGPFVYEPTILTGVRDGMELFSAETFGPVVAIYPVASNHEAIERANDSPYGLNATIYSRDVELARRTAARLACGTVTINDTYAAGWASLEAPMGGFKDSGLGRRHGAEGILKFTESQNITLQRGMPVAPLPNVSRELFSRWFTRALRAMRWVPRLD